MTICSSIELLYSAYDINRRNYFTKWSTRSFNRLFELIVIIFYSFSQIYFIFFFFFEQTKNYRNSFTRSLIASFFLRLCVCVCVCGVETNVLYIYTCDVIINMLHRLTFIYKEDCKTFVLTLTHTHTQYVYIYTRTHKCITILTHNHQSVKAYTLHSIVAYKARSTPSLKRVEFYIDYGYAPITVIYCHG